MGRKTWDSLGRPLPGRLNIVVSRQADLVLEGAEVYPSLEAAVVRAEAWAKEQGVDELMLIGGAQLYAQGLAQADRLYLTRVALSPEGDAWFPEFDLNQWKLVSNVPNPAEGDKPAYNFEVWEKPKDRSQRQLLQDQRIHCRSWRSLRSFDLSLPRKIAACGSSYA